MKTITTIFILTLTTNAFCQFGGVDSAECFTPLKQQNIVVDSNWINKTRPLKNIQVPNVVCYYSEGGINIAYYTTDKNRWTTFYLPFNERTNDFRFIDLDKKGQPELVVKGNIQEYGSGGGTGHKWLMIFNLDSVPTRLFKAYYGCYEELFGDKTKEGEGAFVNSYERTIEFKDREILISPVDKKKFPFDNCGLTEIPSGTYVMDNGRIKKTK